MTNQVNPNEDDLTPINKNIKKIEQEDSTSIVDFDGDGLRIRYNEPEFRQFLSYVYSKNSRQLDSVLPHDYFILERKHLDNINNAIIKNVYTRDKIEKPDSFIMKLYFEDGNKVDAYFLKELEDYVLDDQEVVQIEINWIYYIQFADRPYPEKQEIYLNIETDINKIEPSYNEDKNDFYSPKEKISLIQLVINHTEYSWATAIKNDIIKSLKSCRLHTPGWRKFIYNFESNIVIFLFLVMTSALIIGLERIEAFHRSILIEKLTSVPYGNITVNQKINTIIELIIREIQSGNISSKTLPYLMISLIIITLLVFAVAYLANGLIKPYDRSFILLSDGSTRSKARYYNRHKNNSLHLFLTFMFSIIASICAVYIDQFLQYINRFPTTG